MCTKCKGKHLANSRLAGHKIVNYQQMIFNANKFQKKDDSANTSISPIRRGVSPVDGSKPTKSPKISRAGADGTVSANSSGRFSVRNSLGMGESVIG